jgi:hypothetical protein
LFHYLFQFISESYLKPDTEVESARERPKIQRHSRCVLLIGIRSPSDQLQVVAIPDKFE